MQTGCNGSQKPEFPCQVCGKVLNQKDNLREHLRAHAGQKETKKKHTYNCEYCNKECFYRSTLLKHRRIHTGERLYECQQCFAKFAEKGTLNRHIKAHTAHSCQFCGKTFLKKSQLRAHSLHHTGKKRYLCEICGKTFSRNFRLKLHTRYKHEGAKTFMCTVCNKALQRKEDVKRHQIVHSGVKAYACAICEKRFAMKSSLKIHLLIHSEESPAKCDKCGRTFNRQHYLLRHMQYKHRDMLAEIITDAEKNKLEAQLLGVKKSSETKSVASTSSKTSPDNNITKSFNPINQSNQEVVINKLQKQTTNLKQPSKPTIKVSNGTDPQATSSNISSEFPRTKNKLTDIKNHASINQPNNTSLKHTMATTQIQTPNKQKRNSNQLTVSSKHPKALPTNKNVVNLYNVKPTVAYHSSDKDERKCIKCGFLSDSEVCAACHISFDSKNATVTRIETPRVSVVDELRDPEIDAMALKMKESFLKNASAAAKQSASPANVYINRAGRPVTLTIAPSTTNSFQKHNQEKLTNDSEDIESYKNRYGFELIAGYAVPYIIRKMNGEHLKYVSVRMAETQLLSNYLHYLHSDICSCTSVRSLLITDVEAKLLNEINQKYCDHLFGKEVFLARKGYIVRLEDVIEFHTFIETCYKKLLCNVSTDGREKCGFIRINFESVVPYCFKDNHQYVPLFYFEGETEDLKHQAVKLENWNLAYLKFCCKVQGIRNELFDTDSVEVTTLDDIKNYYPINTHFEEYWPAKTIDSHLLINQKSTHVNPPGAWSRTPPEVVPAERSIRHALTAPTPVVPQSMPVMVNTYQNAWPANQMGPVMPQNSSPINSVGHVVLPPPLVRVSNTAPVIGNTVSYSNIGPISQNGMTTIYNPLNNSNVMSQSSQMRQFYTQHTSNNSQAQQQQQQQQIINTPQARQSYNTSSQPSHGRLTNTQQHNVLRNVVTAPATEIIDLSSPPSTPPPPTVPETTICPNVEWELTRIAERLWAHDPSNSAPYKIQKATLLGRVIHCINAKPYIYSDLMVTIDDLVQTVLPSCTIDRCANVLYEYLKVVLYTGNSEQMAVLRENGHLRSLDPEHTPMAMLSDITQVVLQLKALVAKQDDTIQSYQSAGG